MNRKTKWAVALLALSAVVQPVWVTARTTLAPITDTGYVKECGSCHMVYPPELLPARSWTKIMGSLHDHFGDSAQLDAATQQHIHDYLVAHAADKSQNEHSVAIMQSLRPGETPLRITGTPYISGLHIALLDPAWGGKPRPKTVAECGVCHYLSQNGNFAWRNFTVTDEAFRSNHME